MVQHVTPAVLGYSLSVLWVVGKILQPIEQGIGLVGHGQIPRLLVNYQFADARNVRCNHRNLHRHGFGDTVWNAVPVVVMGYDRCVDEDVAVRQIILYNGLGCVWNDDHIVFKVERLYKLPTFFFKYAVTNDGVDEVRAFLTKLRQCLKNVRIAFLLHETGNRQ